MGTVIMTTHRPATTLTWAGIVRWAELREMPVVARLVLMSGVFKAGREWIPVRVRS